MGTNIDQKDSSNTEVHSVELSEDHDSSSPTIATAAKTAIDKEHEENGGQKAKAKFKAPKKKKTRREKIMFVFLLVALALLLLDSAYKFLNPGPPIVTPRPQPTTDALSPPPKPDATPPNATKKAPIPAPLSDPITLPAPNVGEQNLPKQEPSSLTLPNPKKQNPVQPPSLDPIVKEITKELLPQSEITATKEKVSRPTQAPPYHFTGAILVYNCQQKHWACVNQQAYSKCLQWKKYTQQENLPPVCSVEAEYPSISDCSAVQLYFINTLHRPTQC